MQATVLILVATITTTGGIIGILIQQFFEFRKASMERAEVRRTVAKTNESQGERLEQIHILVNSRLTEALTDIRKLKKELSSEKKKKKKVLR